MSTAAAPPSLTLHRPAAAAAPGNAAHLANLDKLFRNRGAAVESTSTPSTVEPVIAGTRRRQQPLLRLPSFLARIKAGEDLAAAPAMSPRRLERLLQPIPPDGPSPRGNIAATWRRLHGEDGWRGLLDPLHPDLRREIVRYGEFVDAAYAAFLAHPDASPEHRAPPRVPLHDAAYRVTAPLFATSSVELPTWAAAAAGPCVSQRTSLVGYVAVCDSPAELRRMGRRDIVVALRGTCTLLEWAENIRASLVPAGTNSGKSSDDAKVECGFWNIYKTRGEKSPSLSQTVVSEIRRLLDLYKGEELSITVTGHSLGAALAVLIADELAGGVAAVAGAPVAVFSFGGPRVGNGAFASRVERRGARVLRVVNAHDVVPRFLPAWCYADVGPELRLDSRASPFLRPDADAACCHDLEAYIHLVDGFLGSHCPFRDNAKRSILRLVKNQGGNVKQLYMSKAKDMRIQLDADMTGAMCGGRVDMPGAASTVVECVH
ncbi:unnamed protein product [Urochloa humidicola]